MTTRRTLNAPDGDLAADFALIDGVESVTQRVQQRLRLFAGEWYLDTAAGIPWLPDLLRGPEYIPVIARIVSIAAAEVDGVATVDDTTVDFDRNTRQLSLAVTITTDAGETATVAP